MAFGVMMKLKECGLVQFAGKRLPASEMFAGACTEAFYQLAHVLWCELFLTGYS
jgi:hypothetical protein